MCIVGEFIIANVSTPIGAEAICEIPFDAGVEDELITHFRQVYFMNGNPFNFKKRGFINYKEARSAYEHFMAPSGRTTELIVDHRELGGHNHPAAQARDIVIEMEGKIKRCTWKLRDMAKRPDFIPNTEYRRVSNELRDLKTRLPEVRTHAEDLEIEHKTGWKRRREPDDPKFNAKDEITWLDEDIGQFESNLEPDGTLRRLKRGRKESDSARVVRLTTHYTARVAEIRARVEAICPTSNNPSNSSDPLAMSLAAGFRGRLDGLLPILEETSPAPTLPIVLDDLGSTATLNPSVEDPLRDEESGDLAVSAHEARDSIAMPAKSLLPTASETSIGVDRAGSRDETVEPECQGSS